MVSAPTDRRPAGSSGRAGPNDSPAVQDAGPSWLRPDLGLAGVFAVALLLRLAVVFNSRGGPFGDFGYDSSVYYSAADALLHGRMPYSSFTLLHPPALMLVLTPFAYLGTLTTDHSGFIVANTAFEILGAVNATLVVVLARRLGAGRAAALTGGFFYAAWPGAVGAEISARLEPLGNFFLLCALLILAKGCKAGWTTRGLIGCGMLLGAAAVTKIWWSVPLVIVIAWAVVTLRRRSWPLIVGALASTVCVAGPFFVHAPGDMWRMIVSDQLARPSIHSGFTARIGELTSLVNVLPHAGATTIAVLATPIAVVFVMAVRRTWRYRAARLVAVLAVAQLLVLLTAPSYFGFYADFLAPTGAVVLALALSARPDGGRSVRAGRSSCVVATVVLLCAAAAVEIGVNAPSSITAFPGARLAAAVQRAHLRCVMADSPMALIELDVLSRDLSNGCQDRVDVSGSTYDRDRPPNGRSTARVDNLRWQRDLYHYLLSGNAEIVIRHATGISPRTEHRLDRLPVIADIDGKILRRTP